MPSSLKTAVLVVDANVIHEVDTSNAQNLFSMWNVFSSCGDSVMEGRRLENLTWRVWTRETLCVRPNGRFPLPVAPQSPVKFVPQAQDIASPPHSRRSPYEDMPQLSASVDSAIIDEAIDSSSVCAPMDIAHPKIRRQDSSCMPSRSRGQEKHISSDHLEKMVMSIVVQKQPIDAPLPEIPASISPAFDFTKATPSLTERSGSTTSEGSNHEMESPLLQPSPPLSSPDLPRPTRVVHAFSPSQMPRPRAAIASSTAVQERVPAPKSILAKKPQAMFTMGGSSGEDSYSDRNLSLPSNSLTATQHVASPEKKKIFKVGGSSEDDNSLKSAMASFRVGSHLNPNRKVASFANVIDTIIPQTTAIDDDDDSESYVDESAIDDDDDASDWEDSMDDSGKSSIDDKGYFHKVDSRVNLTSRRSLLTMEFERNFPRRGGSSNLASRSTPAIRRQPQSSPLNPQVSAASPNDSDEAPLMMKKTAPRPTVLKPNTEVPRTAAQPIMTTTNGIKHQIAFSPRTTRRNMLSTELTDSLRRNLLWERSMRSGAANAVLKRRHTSQDVKNLKQYPDMPYQAKDADFNEDSNNSWDNLTHDYHAKGW